MKIEQIRETIETVPEVLKVLEARINTGYYRGCADVAVTYSALRKMAAIESLPLRHLVFAPEKLAPSQVEMRQNRLFCMREHRLGTPEE